ncbi:cystathionine gamma-lyase-like [Oppia nitens]|uniref:cystathionine gamma-lyase-like n=1 Tax=Oppia nitens TaxID=1686743 RepID=UPI0023DAAA4A|nr:cystathionine gamma-lyase-like [Oppia nitens]
MSSNHELSTRAIHCGQSPDQWTHRALIPPIVSSTTFELSVEQLFDTKFIGNEYDYSRTGNPTRKCLETALASLELAKYGLCFSSGMATTVTCCHLLSTGDHVLSCDDIYGGSHRYFTQCLYRSGIDLEFGDFTDLSDVANKLRPTTRLIWVETPSNPLMKVVDLKALCELRDRKAPQAIIACDNTFMSPLFQRPLDFGVDLSVHSVTKYINGHSDVIMGAILTNREDLYIKLKFLQNALGTVSSPFDCYLVNRGLKTLTARMAVHQTNGLEIARYLESHPMVTQVLHSGLPSHPQHELARKQCRGFSGMISFRLKGDAQQTQVFLKSLKLFKLVVSLGSVESRVELPARMSHLSVPRERLQLMTIDDQLLRLSVGIEDFSDLIADLEEALKCVQKSLPTN